MDDAVSHCLDMTGSEGNPKGEKCLKLCGDVNATKVNGQTMTTVTSLSLSLSLNICVPIHNGLGEVNAISATQRSSTQIKGMSPFLLSTLHPEQ